MGEKQAAAQEPKQALYRQYRSTSFDEVVGQEHITDLLKAAVTNGAFGHAYLFTGQKGTGKTSVARILAYAINQLPYTTDTQHLDIIEIDAASNRRIDDIRDLREKVHIAPVSAPYKVYIIDEVHMLTGESFNALLKTLEEPPAHAIFILATTELHKVPATIISRTQRFHFRPVARDKVVAHLKSIAEKETISVDDAALTLIAEYGGGSFRDSIGLLDQLGSLKQGLTTELVESILGRAGAHAVESLIAALETNDTGSVHTLLEQLSADGVSPVTLAEQLTRAILSLPQQSRRWYDLASALMAIPKAQFPQLLLAATLLQFAAQPTGVAPAPKKQSRDTSHTPAPTPTPQKTPAPAAPTPKESVTEPEVTQKETPQTGTFDWSAVLATVKKTSPPLYSILSKATVEGDNDRVVFRFQYALHRKRLEQPTYRTQVARLIQDVCHVSPEIVIEHGTAGAHDETTQQVAAIMGGGESVTV